MTGLRTLLAFLPSLVAGVALVDLLWPTRRPSDWLLKLVIGFGIGTGLTSCLDFFWFLLFSPANKAYFWLEAAAAATLAAASALRWRKSRLVVFNRPILRRPSGLAIAGLAVLLVVGLAGAYSLWNEVAVRPNGNFDAYATWNLRARALFFSTPESWTVAFSPLLSWKTHADYPLLWSLNLLRSWQALGRALPQAGQVQTLLFGLAAGGLMFAGLLRLRGFIQAALGSILLVSMPWFIHFNAFQQADGPLAFFYLLVILLLFKVEQGYNPAVLGLAGLAAGLAGWTKNDGLVFLLAVILYLLVRYLRRPIGRSLGQLVPFGVGLVLPLVTILIFKVRLAPPGDLIGAQTAAELVSKAADPARWGMILSAVWAALPGLGGWSWPAAAGLPLYGLLAGRQPGVNGFWLWLVPGITLLGYIGVYLVTPHDLAWHLQYSLTRLLFHLLPVAIFLLLALAKNPTHILHPDQAN